MEYLLQTALKSNLQKEKLLRGTEDLVQEINQKIENVVAVVQFQIPVAKRTKETLKIMPKMPVYTGSETIYDRLHALSVYTSMWESEVHEQIGVLQQ